VDDERFVSRVCFASIIGVGLTFVAACTSLQAPGEPGPMPPGSEPCTARRDRCTELCSPLGVRHFSCVAETEGAAFECECLDGSKPFEVSR
jgi:hypothetical protein